MIYICHWPLFKQWLACSLPCHCFICNSANNGRHGSSSHRCHRSRLGLVLLYVSLLIARIFFCALKLLQLQCTYSNNMVRRSHASLGGRWLHDSRRKMRHFCFNDAKLPTLGDSKSIISCLTSYLTARPRHPTGLVDVEFVPVFLILIDHRS